MKLATRLTTVTLGLIGLLGPLAVATGTPATAADVGAAKPPVPRLNWKACGPAHPGFLCTTAEVPTDYDTPRGATTTIA